MEQSPLVWAVAAGPEAPPHLAAVAHRLAADLAGALEVIVCPQAPPPATAAALARLASRRRPRAILLCDDSLGREVAARLAARLGAGLATGCRQVEAGEGGEAPPSLRVTRSALGGLATCRLTLTSSPAVLTIEAESAGSRATAPPGAATLTLPIGRDDGPGVPEVLEVQAVDPFEMELEEAEVIVAGGAGAGGPEGFALLGELARRLGGAVGASRVAVDLGWVPYHRQVGQSGRVVSPRLYIACGISGASHHLVGIRDAETVVAINSDPHAPIVGRADLALVGDVRAVVTALIEQMGPPCDGVAARGQAVRAGAGPA